MYSVLCPDCHFVNPADATYCLNCSTAFGLEPDQGSLDPGSTAWQPGGRQGQIVPPGAAPKSGDLPPRRECAPLWHARLRAALPAVRLPLLVGSHAQAAYLPPALGKTMAERVRWHDEAPPGLFPLPHPAWRSRLWMADNPWFEAEVLPLLRARVVAALA